MRNNDKEERKERISGTAASLSQSAAQTDSSKDAEDYDEEDIPKVVGKNGQENKIVLNSKGTTGLKLA